MLFETLVYTGIIYFSTDIGRDFGTYLSISLSITVSGVCAMAYGFFLSGLFESYFIGTELSSILDLILLLVSGAYMNVSAVPLLKYISFFFYANENVFINFWTTIEEIKCSPRSNVTCYPDGVAVLESFSFGTSTDVVYKNYLYQLVLIIVLHFLAFLGIRRIVRKTGFY